MKIGLLKQKDFSLLMMGKFISIVGTGMQDFVLSLYVFKKTGSAVLFASVLIASLIPQILLAPIAGVLADWLDRKKIIVYLDLLSALVVGGFAVQCAFKDGLSLPSVYIFVILLTLISVLYQPAISTVIPTIIKSEDLVDANGMNSLIMNIGGLISPLIAGVLFPIFGLFVILVANAISFIIASIGETFINIPKTNHMPEKVNIHAFRTDLLEGINFIKGKKIIITIIVLGPILNFVFSGLSIGLICIAKRILEVSDFQFSIIQIISVLSMMAAPFVASGYVKKYSLGKILFLGCFMSSLLIAIIGIVPTKLFLNLFNGNFIPYAALLFIMFFIGLIMTTVNIALSSLFQKIVPLSMMGRVGTVMNTCMLSCMPFGQLIFGFLFDSISAWICVLICSLILFISVLCFRKSLLAHEENSIEITSSAEIQIN